MPSHALFWRLVWWRSSLPRPPLASVELRLRVCRYHGTPERHETEFQSSSSEADLLAMAAVAHIEDNDMADDTAEEDDNACESSFDSHGGEYLRESRKWD